MAPEVSYFLPYDMKVDIFSFAMIEFEILFGEHHLSSLDGTRKLLFSNLLILSKLGFGVLCAIRNGDRPIIPDDRHEYSGSLKGALKKAWHSHPANRPTAQEFLDRIRKDQFPFGDSNDEEDEDIIEKEEDDKEDIQSVRDEIMSLLRGGDKGKDVDDVDQDVEINTVYREIDQQERSQSVEEVSVVEVKEASRVGSITCLIGASDILPALSTWFAGTLRPVVVGATSRGYLLSWDEKVFLPYLLKKSNFLYARIGTICRST